MQNSNAPQQQQPKTLKQKMNVAAAFASYPATMVMIFMRRKLGLRFLDTIKLFIMTAFLYALASFFSTSDPKTAAAIAIFATAALILSFVHRHLRFREIKRGISWHSYSRGIPWLATLAPQYEEPIKRFLDPIICFIAGILIALVFRGLGFYIMFSAICLAALAQWDKEQQLNSLLDTLDGEIEGDVMTEDLTYFSQGAAPQRSISETEGIATGTAPEITALIARRRQRRAEAAQAQAAQPRPQQQPQPQQVPFTNGQQWTPQPLTSTDKIPTHPLQYEQPPRQQRQFTAPQQVPNGRQQPPQTWQQ